MKTGVLWTLLQVATALTVYGIETRNNSKSNRSQALHVVTALTVYGIETS